MYVLASEALWSGEVCALYEDNSVSAEQQSIATCWLW